MFLGLDENAAPVITLLAAFKDPEAAPFPQPYEESLNPFRT